MSSILLAAYIRAVSYNYLGILTSGLVCISTNVQGQIFELNTSEKIISSIDPDFLISIL